MNKGLMIAQKKGENEPQEQHKSRKTELCENEHGFVEVSRNFN